MGSCASDLCVWFVCCASCNLLRTHVDLVYEEVGGCGSEEETKDICSADTRTERRVFSSCYPRVAHMAQRALNVILPFTDLTELDLPSTMKTQFPDPADLLNFTLTITPDEGKSYQLLQLTSQGFYGCSHRYYRDVSWRRLSVLICH